MPRVNAVMDFNFPSSPGKVTYQMVKLNEIDGQYHADKLWKVRHDKPIISISRIYNH